MPKGKYAAKSANRLADLDNQLLQEKIAEIFTLRKQLDQLAAELAAERKERGAIVLKRSQELAEQRVLEARRGLAEVESARKDVLMMIADYLVDMFKKAGKPGEEVWYPSGFVDLLPVLIPDSRDRSSFLNNMLDNRNGDIAK